MTNIKIYMIHLLMLINQLKILNKINNKTKIIQIWIVYLNKEIKDNRIKIKDINQVINNLAIVHLI